MKHDEEVKVEAMQVMKSNGMERGVEMNENELQSNDDGYTERVMVNKEAKLENRVKVKHKVHVVEKRDQGSQMREKIMEMESWVSRSNQSRCMNNKFNICAILKPYSFCVKKIFPNYLSLEKFKDLIRVRRKSDKVGRK